MGFTGSITGLPGLVGDFAWACIPVSIGNSGFLDYTFYMRVKVIFISRLHMVRKQVAESFEPLGYWVKTYGDYNKPVGELPVFNPSVIMLDGDGCGDEWLGFLDRLQTFQGAIILFKSHIDFNQTREAATRGVSSIIVKPFKPTEHVEKIHHFIDNKLRIEEKRTKPRFYFQEDFNAKIQYYVAGGRDLNIMPLENITDQGATVILKDQRYREELRPGRRIVGATLLLGAAKIPLSFRVVFRERNRAGVLFQEMRKSRHAFQKVIQGFMDQVFGVAGPSDQVEREKRW
jgi:hypothetical protein